MRTKKKKMCSGKVRYETGEAAKFLARADGARAYPCPHCGGWHLTYRINRAEVKRRSRRRVA